MIWLHTKFPKGFFQTQRGQRFKADNISNILLWSCDSISVGQSDYDHNHFSEILSADQPKDQ